MYVKIFQYAVHKINVDINECAIGTDNCDAHAVCTNTIGSFTCACRSGYRGNGLACSGNLNQQLINIYI